MAKKVQRNPPTADAGYSGTPLAVKLGIKAGHRVLLLSAPKGFEETLDGLADGAKVSRRAGKSEWDVIVAFVERAADLAGVFGANIPNLAQAGGIWIAWPNPSFRKDPTIGDAAVRAAGLSSGLVDVKVCAVSDAWSGLRFVRRLKDRARPVAG